MAEVQAETRSESTLVAELFEQHQTPLQRYALGLTHRKDTADDLVGDTFARALLNQPLLHRLNAHQRRAWLYRVLRNRFFDLQRRDRRTDHLIHQLGQQARSKQDDLVIPWEWLAVLDDAPRRYRELLRKRYELGMTSTEIGREMGIPSATVRSRLRLAIRWLRTHCADS